MTSFLTIEEIKIWRSSTEKITLEEFAQRLGKSIETKKETNDLYDIIINQETIPEISTNPISEIPFSKELSSREKTIFNYFTQNKGKKVSVKELARLLNLPNSYVYKYIKNLREKLTKNILVNAEDGGYILSI